MKKHFIYALIVSIILSNCFSTAIFAQDLAGPPEVMEITEDMLIPEEAPEVEGYQEAEPFDVALEEEAPEIAVEEADEPEADAALTETPSTTVEQADDPEAIPELADPAAPEELTGDGGSCGPNATWEISGSMLKIKGEGAMYDYDSMGTPWYNDRNSIKTVYVEDGITEIGINAFFELNYVLDISLPSSLKRIEKMAFYRCRNLPTIEIPSGVLYIGEQAFNGCQKLKNVSFLGNSPQIQGGAFFSVSGDVFYPAANNTWTNARLQYGGALTWRAATTFYDIWVAGIRINSANRSDVLKDGGNVRYVPSSNTLYMNQATLPAGLHIARNYMNQHTTAISAIGDLTIQGNMAKSDMAAYVEGELIFSYADFQMDYIYAHGLKAFDSSLRLPSISGGSITIDNSELYANSLWNNLYDSIVIENNSTVDISSSGANNAVTCGAIDISNSNVNVERPEGSAIVCMTDFKVSNSTLTVTGKDSGIMAPRIKILSGNTIVAKGAKGAIYGVEDTMSAPMEIARGYVFLAPANPIIGTYGIRENGKYATYVSMRPLNSSDLPGIRRGATAVSKIELPTLKTSQLTLKTKDGYYVTGNWISGNTDIASVDATGLVKAKKYGLTKIICRTDNSSYSCDLQTRFYDVADPKQSGYEKIYWGVEKGIIGGFGGVYFGPEQPCTRLQFAIMLWRSQNKPAASGTLSFPDTANLNPQTDSYKAVLWASKAGIINGFSDKTFGPDRNITREQIVIILWRLAEKPKATKAPTFTDTKNLDKNSTSYKAIAWASEAGIVNGFSDKTFRKDENSKRNQIIIMIYRYVNR